MGSSYNTVCEAFYNFIPLFSVVWLVLSYVVVVELAFFLQDANLKKQGDGTALPLCRSSRITAFHTPQVMSLVWAPIPHPVTLRIDATGCYIVFPNSREGYEKNR